jgi:catechol 2,3-dioxygenase-like lactoylglutathione lyase family enzyme
MDWKLELVVVPVSDVERAKAFYSEKLGFNVDHDTKISDEFHIVQLTPPGSGCSIAIGIGINEMLPGSVKGLQLVVPDLPAARAELIERGLDVGEIQVFGRDGSRRAALPDEHGPVLNNSGFLFFDDPDGNSWAVQQINRS